MLDPKAKSQTPHVVLDKTHIETRFDHCPGFDASAPVIDHAWELRTAGEAGYSLGELRDTLAPELDLILDLKMAVDVARGMPD